MSSAILRTGRPLNRARLVFKTLTPASSSHTHVLGFNHRFTSFPACQRFNTTMADQTVVFTKDAPFPLGPYSQAIKTPFAIFCSGQIPLNADGTFVEGSIADKTRKCCENLEAVLREAGSSLSKVVKTTIFLSSMDFFPDMNEEYGKHFTHKPARSCVAVKTLPKGVDVEIEAIALA